MRAPLLLVVVLCSCAGPALLADGGMGGGAGGGTVSTLAGPLAFEVAAAQVVYPYWDGGPPPSDVTGFLSSFGLHDFCENTTNETTETVVLEISRADGGVRAGSYPLRSPGSAETFVLRQTLGPDGRARASAVGVDGEVRLVKADSTGVSGSFEVTLESADGGLTRLSGAFDMPSVRCPN